MSYPVAYRAGAIAGGFSSPSTGQAFKVPSGPIGGGSNFIPVTGDPPRRMPQPIEPSGTPLPGWSAGMADLVGLVLGFPRSVPLSLLEKLLEWWRDYLNDIFMNTAIYLSTGSGWTVQSTCGAMGAYTQWLGFTSGVGLVCQGSLEPAGGLPTSINPSWTTASSWKTNGVYGAPGRRNVKQYQSWRKFTPAVEPHLIPVTVGTEFPELVPAEFYPLHWPYWYPALKPLVLPLIETLPQLQPVTWPSPPTRVVPFRLRPAFSRALQRGVVRTVGPGPRAVAAEALADGALVPSYPPAVLAPPGPGTKERKMKASATLLRSINTATEAVDFIECVWKSIPTRKGRRKGRSPILGIRKAGRTVMPNNRYRDFKGEWHRGARGMYAAEKAHGARPVRQRWDTMMSEIYKYWDLIDWSAAIVCQHSETATDAAYGQTNAGVRNLVERNGGSIRNAFPSRLSGIG